MHSISEILNEGMEKSYEQGVALGQLRALRMVIDRLNEDKPIDLEFITEMFDKTIGGKP